MAEPQKQQTAQGAASGSSRHSSWLRHFALAALFVLGMLCALFVAPRFYRPAITHGHSMEPTLSDGDWALAAVHAYTPACGDVVIIRDMHREDAYIVKRIIGLPGDCIDIDFYTGEVTRNGVTLVEPYIAEPTTYPGDLLFPLTVPEHHAFVLGDNRNQSTDSRTSYTGMIPLENIKGRVVWRLYPFHEFGKIQ